MGQGHRADAKAVQQGQDVRAFFQCVAVFNRENGGQFIFCMCTLDVARRMGDEDVGAEFFDFPEKITESIHQIEQVVTPRPGAVDGEESRVEAALAHLAYVELDPLAQGANILAQIGHRAFAFGIVRSLGAV